MASLAASSAGPPVPLKSLLPLEATGVQVQDPSYARNDGNIPSSIVHAGSTLVPPLRPGLGRHMSSVSNLIDAYTSSPRGSASFSGGTVFTPPSPSYIVSGKPGAQSPSSPLRHSQIPLPLGGRRASVDAAAARQDSSGDPASRGRRPSAPDIFSPTSLAGTRDSGARAASATASTTESQAASRAVPTVIDRPSQPQANSPVAPYSSPVPAPQPAGASADGGNGLETMNGTIDVKRLLSKPAPPQQHVQHHSTLHSLHGSSVSPNAMPNLAVRGSASPGHATTSSGFTTAAAGASSVASSSSSGNTSHAIGQHNSALSSSTSAAMRAEVVEAKPSCSLTEGDTWASKEAKSSSVTELVSDPADSASLTANKMGASQSLAHTASSPHVLALSFEPHNSRLPFFEHAPARDDIDSNSAHYSARQAGTSAHPSYNDRAAHEGSSSSSMSAVNQVQTHAQKSSASDGRTGVLQSERLASPQTPRKTRNNDTAMASAVSIGAYSPRSSSILRSPDSPSPPRRHTSTHARPLPASSGQSPFSASSPSTITLRRDHDPYGPDLNDQPSRQHGLLPLQPAFPPMTGIIPQSTNLDGEPYESVLPPSSILRPGPRQLLDNSHTTHHPTLQHSSHSSPIFSTSSSSANSPSTSKHNSPLQHRGGTTANHNFNSKVLSPTGLSNGSPSQTARKLVRKSSRGHMKKDAGTPGSDMLPSHSRSLSIPRVAPSTRRDGHGRSSTTGNTGSGSSSEQEESASANLDHCYSLPHRPAWLDQDPTTSLHHNQAQNHNAQHVWPPAPLHQESSSRLSADHDNVRRPRTPTGTSLGRDASTGSAVNTEESPQTLPKRKPSFYRRKRSQTASSVPVATDRNGFPMPSPLSEMVKNMPVTGQDNSLTHQLQPKRSTSGGGFLSSLTKKLSHPNLKEAASFDAVGLEPSPDYFGARTSQDTLDKPNAPPKTVQSSPKPPHSNTGSTFAPKAWLASLTGHAGTEAKPDSKALPNLPTTVQSHNSGKVVYEDPFSAASSISLPAFGFPSRKDSLASQRSDPSDHGSRKSRTRSRTLSNDGDSSEGHSSEGGHAANRNFDLSPPPVPDLPAGMRLAVSPPNATPASLPRTTKKSGSSLLRSPSLGFRRAGTAAQDSSPKPQHKGDQSPGPAKGSTRQVDGNGEDGTFTSQPRRLSLQALDKANDSITTARKHGLSLKSGSAVNMSARDTEAPSKLGSVAALDKIALAEDNLRETKFMALLDRSDRADQGVIKLSLASSAAKEAGIA